MYSNYVKIILQKKKKKKSAWTLPPAGFSLFVINLATRLDNPRSLSDCQNTQLLDVLLQPVGLSLPGSKLKVTFSTCYHEKTV